MKKRDIFIVCGAVLMAAVLCAWALATPAVATASWGLSFPIAGQTPQGPATIAQLKKYDAAYVGDASQRVVYLTFDAGYENGCTEKILDVLKQQQVPAAFFLVAGYMEKNPDLVRRMVDEGHIVGNHTVHHYNMSKLSDEDTFRAELQGVEEAFTRVTGKVLPKYYRPPQGIYSEDNLKAAQKLGYRTVFWSLAYVDWLEDSQPTCQQALDKLLPRLHNGTVLLLHSTSRTNAAVLRELLTKIADKGYAFRSIDELFI